MARAQFQKGQKVWVECVGAWAFIEQVQPVWAKGFDEPVRVTYDVGLGREFTANELMLAADDRASSDGLGNWRLLRAHNKWQLAEDCLHHPYPGTYPVVVTDTADWGGWRVPGAEYDRTPDRIEYQARLIAASPALLKLAEDLIDLAAEAPDDAPPAMLQLARQAREALQSVNQVLTAAPEKLPSPAAAA